MKSMTKIAFSALLLLSMSNFLPSDASTNSSSLHVKDNQQENSLPRVIVSQQEFDATTRTASYYVFQKCTIRKNQNIEECHNFLRMPVAETRDGMLSAIALLHNVKIAHLVNEIVANRLAAIEQYEQGSKHKYFIPGTPEKLRKEIVSETDFDKSCKGLHYSVVERCTQRNQNSLECVKFLLCEMPESSQGIMSSISFLENGHHGHLIDKLIQERLQSYVRSTEFSEYIRNAAAHKKQ